MNHAATRALCDACGSSLDLDLPSGFCPGCLLDTVLASDSGAAAGSEIEDYELLGEIARGGMGIVYRARQRVPARIVALKMILPAHLHSLGALNRFRAEAEAAASLEHESILPIYAVGEADGAPFYTMKLAEGGTLSQRIGEYRDKPREAAALLAHLARAVAFAHEHGILHRDLKPGNVLFDSLGKPYVSDFGLAKWLQRECDLTQTLAILGTPYYMAPEQARDSKAVTTAADIYSLGAILYHLLCGKPPIDGETPIEVLHRANSETPCLTNRSVPRDLATICLKCLERETGARYASAEALAEDLESFCAHRPIRARPAGLTNRGWRWTRRNPVVAGLAACSFILLLVLIVRDQAQRAEERKPTRNREALALYDKGTVLMRKPMLGTAGYEEAQRCFEQAVALDPNFAFAHARLSRVLSALYIYYSPTDAVHRAAKREAEEALRLQPESGEAHLAIATLLNRVEHEYAPAVKEYDIAQRTLPNDSYVYHGRAHARMRLGDYDGAIIDYERATALDPGNWNMWDALGNAYSAMRKLSAAEHAKRRMLDLLGDVPANVRFNQEQSWAVAYLDLTGSFEKLDEIFARGMLSPQDDPDGAAAFERFDGRLLERNYADAEQTLKATPTTIFELWGGARVTRNFAFAMLALAQGDRAKARPFLTAELQFAQQETREMPESASRHAQLGLIYAYLDRKDEAIAEGQRAVELLPISKDAFDGTLPLNNLAQIYAWLGEADKALDLVEELLRIPNGEIPLHLQQFWFWDPLREHPRFQRLTAQR